MKKKIEISNLPSAMVKGLAWGIGREGIGERNSALISPWASEYWSKISHEATRIIKAFATFPPRAKFNFGVNWT